MRRLRKRMALGLCMLLLLSMTCSNALADIPLADAAEKEAQQNSVMKIDAPKATDSEAEKPEGRTVKIHVIEDALEGEDTTEEVELTQEGTLPDSIKPTREGWKFYGWYDAEITEEYWGDGVDETLEELIETYPTSLRRYNTETGVFDTIEAKYTGDADAQQHHSYEAAMHTWLIETEGEKITVSEKLPDNVTDLYAMFVPRKVEVQWNSNGWKNGMTAAMTSSNQYQGMISPFNIDTVYKWPEHEFLGWYTDPVEGVEVEFNDTIEEGYPAARIGAGEALEPGMKDNGEYETIQLYAHWTGGKDTTSIRLVADKTTVDPNKGASAKINIELKITPRDANWPKQITWTLDRQDMHATLTPWYEYYNGAPHGGAYLQFSGQPLGDDNAQMTVTATTEDGLTASVTLKLCHDWLKQNYEVAAGCDHDGYMLYKCSWCQHTKRVTIPSTGHTRVIKETAPTCTENGYQEITCRDCDKLDEKVITSAALGHQWGPEQRIEGCGGTTITRTCEVCGFAYTAWDGTANHQWASEPTVDKEPTCGMDGSQSIHCLNCGATKDSKVLHANPDLHQWSKWYVRRQATEAQDGESYRTCSVCGLTETASIKYVPPVKVDTWENGAPPEEETPKEDLPSEEQPKEEEPEVPKEEDTPGSTTPDSGSESSGSESSGSESSGSGSGSGSSSGSSSSGSSSSGGSSGGGGGGGGGGGSRTTASRNGQTAQGPVSSPAPTVVPGSGGSITQVVNVTANANTNAAAGLANAQVASGAWVQDTQGMWKLQYSDGSVASNSWICVAENDGAHWYHFGGTGVMDTGWLNLDGKVYYLAAEHNGTAGRMLTGWQMVNGKWYYFSTANDATIGSLLTNTTTPDGYLNAQGEWIQ